MPTAPPIRFCFSFYLSHPVPGWLRLFAFFSPVYCHVPILVDLPTLAMCPAILVGSVQPLPVYMTVYMAHNSV